MNDQRGETGASYAARLAAENGRFRNCVDVHNLPEIFHYWSNRYIRPKVEALGFTTPNDLFRKYVAECGARSTGPARFASIGSGNCELEVSLAGHLRSTGQSGFVIDCLDANSAMLDRGRMAAQNDGLSGYLNFVAVDLNEWTPACEYDAVIANQILHHVVKLEDLFATIKDCLKSEGALIVSDMIGRNGHQRWPEALGLVEEFWRRLPPSYRFNHALQRYEELFEDWDCSGEGFEGIRAQEVLPLLIEFFHFKLFFGFANVIDPFVDRAFGHNFDAAAEWDRSFIDDVHRQDESQIMSGRIKPTHMLAVLANNPVESMIFHEPLTPRFCVRNTSLGGLGARIPGSLDGAPDAYQWHSWPHSPQRELEIACGRLKKSQEQIEAQTARALHLQNELEEKAAGAAQLEQQVNEWAAWGRDLQKQFEERTAWALQLEKELERSAAQVIQLNSELEHANAQMEARTGWALRAQKESEDRQAQVLQLSSEIERLAWARPLDRWFHNPLYFAYRVARRVRGLF